MKPEVRRGITGRSVALGTALAILNALWVTMVEVRFYILDGSSLPLFVTPIFLLLVLVGAIGATVAAVLAQGFWSKEWAVRELRAGR